ncbi:MAG: hypothetical protein Q4A21_02275 [bacterium]|nr:hypothetical protein [bacterium]
MKKISEDDFELKFEEIKNEKIEIVEPIKTQKGENMKTPKTINKIKNFDFNRFFGNLAMIIIAIAAILALGFYLGAEHQKRINQDFNQKVSEQVRNLSQK